MALHKRRMSIKFAVCLLATVIGACWTMPDTMARSQYAADQRVKESMEQNDIATVLKKHTDSLMSLPAVVGTAQGICAGKPCIRIYVTKKSEDSVKQIPANIEGYPVEVQETGEIQPRTAN